ARISSREGRRLAVGGDDGVGLRDTATGKHLGDLLRLSAPGVQHSKTEFSRDSRWLLVYATVELRVYDAATGQPASKPLEVSRGGMTAYFSPDGQRVLVNGYKDSKPIAHVWDWRGGQARRGVQGAQA